MDASGSNMVSQDADYGKARNQTTIRSVMTCFTPEQPPCPLFMLNVNQHRPGVSAQSPQALLPGFFGENTHADR